MEIKELRRLLRWLPAEAQIQHLDETCIVFCDKNGFTAKIQFPQKLPKKTENSLDKAD